MKTVKLLNSIPIEISNNVFDNQVLKNAVLDIPDGSFDDYIATNWGDFYQINTGSVLIKTAIDGELKYRLFPDTVNPYAILIKGDYSNLEEIRIPERITDLSDSNNPVRYPITTIGSEAFRNCTKLKAINFHQRSKITTISPNAFQGCTSLAEISFPETLTTIGNNAFYGCSGLTEITIPSSVTSIGICAFF